MTYAEALAYIASLEPRGWRLGLDRMNEFVRRAELQGAVDGSERKYIHVAGTNGKGSTTAFIQSMLVAAGLRAGAFFSPYVVDPRERIQIGSEMIDALLFAQLTEELLSVAEGMEGTEFAGITEFEFKTALGFLAWRRAGVDWVALETGLGGRLDATNIVTPSACVITSIGLDHQSVLGNSLEEIAAEKAGIVKPGVPLILGDMSEPAANTILQVAADRHAPVWRYGHEVVWNNGRVVTPACEFGGLEPSLRGVWQPHNLSLGIAALVVAKAHLSVESASVGAKSTFAPGRYQKLTCEHSEVILDGAHNADSARALAATLAADYGTEARFTLVTNMLTGHELGAFYGPLRGVVAEAIIPPIDFHRARNPEETARALGEVGIEARSSASVAQAIETAVTSKRPVVVTGSFYLVGEAAKALTAKEGCTRR